MHGFGGGRGWARTRNNKFYVFADCMSVVLVGDFGVDVKWPNAAGLGVLHGRTDWVGVVQKELDAYKV